MTTETSENPQHIIVLSVRNVKRLKAVRITPDGKPLTVISGRNGQGKSSVLDGIIYTLAGGRAEPSRLIRDGEDGASVTIDTEDFIIRKRWTAAGGVVTIEARDGGKLAKPQNILASMIGKICLDPFEFSRLKPAEQAETLKSLTGLDTADIEAKRKSLYDERTNANRDADRLRIRADQAQEKRHADVPRQPIDLEPYRARLHEANDAIAARMKEQEGITKSRRELSDAESRIAAAEREVERLKKELSRAQTNVEMLNDTLGIEDMRKDVEARQKALDESSPISVGDAVHDLETAQALNEKVRENADALKLVSEAAEARERSEELTAKIKECDERKAKMIAEAKMPVPGLAIEEGVVTFNGVPFDQASSAEQIRISCAIGLALNPKLRTLIVREGSLLDDDTMRMLAEIAEENDAQIIMERVEIDGHTSVVIEDGEVADENPQGDLFTNNQA